MFKDVLTHMDLSSLSSAGLLLFFAVFIGVTLYALTRPPRQADRWSRIPLTEEKSIPNRKEDREP